MMTWTSTIGWQMRISRVEWLVMALILAVHSAEAAPQDAITPPGAPPDMEFLEFLGSWDAGDGDVVDPLTLEDMPALDQTGVVREEKPHERESKPGRAESAPQHRSPAVSGEDSDE